MPIEYTGGQTQEGAQNMAEWEGRLAVTQEAIRAREAAESAWQSGDRDKAMQIVASNPNVGVEYRNIVNGTVTESGSYFGTEAARFLSGLDADIVNGSLRGLSSTGQKAPWQVLLERGKTEFEKRLDNKSCGDLFGGKEKALKALKGLKFSPGIIDSGIMEIHGNNVTVDTNRFNDSPQDLLLAWNISKMTIDGHPATGYLPVAMKISGADFAAFALAHEVGHKRKIYGEYDDDNSFDGLAQGANNEKVRAACFSEFKTYKL
jgi:hypothetical protein